MFIYNITIKVQAGIADEWLNWQQSEHIPEIMQSGLFNEFKLFRLMEQDDEDGPTYITQFITPDVENYHKYIDELAPSLREKSFKKWGNQFIAFRSLLSTVQ